VHFIAGVTWIGLLYFFNLVNVPFMKELDPATKGKVLPALMSRALLVVSLGSGRHSVDGLRVLGHYRRIRRAERWCNLRESQWQVSF